LSQPSKYNKKYREEQVKFYEMCCHGFTIAYECHLKGEELKSFYKMEANWGYSSKKVNNEIDIMHPNQIIIIFSL
jgi:hypothetical protein